MRHRIVLAALVLAAWSMAMYALATSAAAAPLKSCAAGKRTGVSIAKGEVTTFTINYDDSQPTGFNVTLVYRKCVPRVPPKVSVSWLAVCLHRRFQPWVCGSCGATADRRPSRV